MTRPLRVLFLEPSGLITGGAIALLRLVEALDKRAFKPLVVLGSQGPLVQRFRQVPGCAVLCLPFPRRLARVTRFGVFTGGMANIAPGLTYGLKLRAIADRWRADIVHSNGLKMHLLSILTRRRKKRLLVWHIRDLLSPAYLPRRSATLMRTLVGLLPEVTICNSDSTRAALAGTARTFVVSSGVPTGMQLGPLHVVFDGVSPNPQDTVSLDRREAQGHRVLMLGRIAEWKGQHVFVHAAQRLCEDDQLTKFIIAGGATTAADAAYERNLRALVEASGLSGRIVFAGVVHEVERFLNTVDLLVHCSTSPEPFGQVIIEGMAASLPVVATNIGGPAEIISDNVNGRLYPPGDDAALARIIRDLLDDAGSRFRLANAARQTVDTSFGIDHTARQVAEIYHRYAPHAEGA